MISVEWNATLKAVTLHLDKEGVQVLKQRLDDLLSDGDHLHLQLGDDLTDTGVMNAVFGELVLQLCPSDLPAARRNPITSVSTQIP